MAVRALRGARDDQGGARRNGGDDRIDQLDGRQRRRERLLRLERWRPDAWQDAGARLGAVRRARQHRRAGSRQHAHVGAKPRRSGKAGEDDGEDAARPAGPARGDRVGDRVPDLGRVGVHDRRVRAGRRRHAGGLVSVRIGAKLPHSGPLPASLGLVKMAQRLEYAGFDSIWVSDHVVFPHEVRSRYPFSADGRPTWAMDIDYIEPLVALAAIAPATSRAEIGTSVLILPARNPVLFAKQAASVDVLSHGRLVLGVGVGWLREEFEALGADFDDRGAVLDEWVDIAR